MPTIFTGDAREVLQGLHAGFVHTCVTSPPYFGLRDYGHGDQIGLEQTPEAFVQKLVAVFREVRRVLRDDGTLWLNIGDSYCSYKGDKYGDAKGNLTARTPAANGRRFDVGTPQTSGVKNKDLIGIPWMLAFALRADGWYLRQDIIWHKPNPMPESVRDRCTKAHEYIFLLSKGPRYYFDSEAIKEPADPKNHRQSAGIRRTAPGSTAHGGPASGNRSYITKNKRSVWSVTVKPFKEAHFATFPPDLIEPCILAGCPESGTVLDPFLGAGTTALVAANHNRNYIGIELNPEYVELAKKRLEITGGTL